MSDACERAAPASPAKCAACDEPLASRLFCDNCRCLYPADGLNHFELLGLAPTFDLDPGELRQKYFATARGVHPDYHGEHGDQTISVHLSAQLNEAQRVLADPVLRAEYLLELAGGPTAVADKRVLDGVLVDTLTLREELEEVQVAGDPGARAACRARVERRHGLILEQIANLARHLPGDDFLRTRLRATLNSIKYYQKLLADL